MPILRNMSLSWSWVDFDIRLCLPIPSRYSGLLSTVVFTEESTTLMCWNPEKWQLEYLDGHIKHQMHLFISLIETSSTLKQNVSKLLNHHIFVHLLSWASTVVAKLLGVCKYKYENPLHLPKQCFPSVWILNHTNKKLGLMTSIASGLFKLTYDREHR